MNTSYEKATRRPGWLAIIGALCWVPGTATAETATGACAAVMDPNNAPSTDPRVQHLIVDGVHVNVLVPPGYAASRRYYPTLYLFHGAFGDEDSFTTQTDLLQFTSTLPDAAQAVIVMPDGGHLPAGRDWVDGTHEQESFVIDTLIPFIATRYRVLCDRSHRAAAGFSAGGMNAMVFAARHPDLFAAAASFSGFLDPLAPAGMDIVQQFASLDDELCGASDDWTGIWGDPSLHPMGWQGHDPVYLAPSLADVALYVSSANGDACPGDPEPDPFLAYAEAVVFDMSQGFDGALTAAGIPHVTDFYGCGIHLFSNANRGLRGFWPVMLRAFQRPLPRTVEYRTGDPVASAWGWSFGADPARAPEFLDVHAASASGFTLTGSGLPSVVTAPLFRPGTFVRVASDDRSSQRIRVDRSGRLTLQVDLGPAHDLEEGTPEQSAAAAANPPYFVTRTVRFEPDRN